MDLIPDVLTRVCLRRPLLRVGILLFLLGVLGVGCAPKVVIQSAPPSQIEPSPSLFADQITAQLRHQFRQWQGVPHRSGGVDRRGVDCSGLMQLVFKEAFRLELPRTSRAQSRMGQSVPPTEMRPGDLVFFLDKGRDHIGVVVEGRIFLHVSSKQGVILSELDAYWWPRLRRVQRVLA